MSFKKEIEIGGRTLTLETGVVAKLCDAAVLATFGGSTVLATVVGSGVPLTVLSFHVLVTSRTSIEPAAPTASTKSVREALSTSALVNGDGRADMLERSNWMKVFCVLAPASMTWRTP